MSRQLLVVGVAGPTRAGKSTLCRRIVESCAADGVVVSVVHQDQFLRSGETPDAVDWRAFIKAIRAECAHAKSGTKDTSKQAARLVLLEGFLLFSHPTVLDACDVRICLSLSEATCYARRKATKRAGLHGDAFDRYFAQVIWPAHRQHGDYAAATAAIDIPAGASDPSPVPFVVIDAEASADDVHGAALAALRPRILSLKG